MSSTSVPAFRRSFALFAALVLGLLAPRSARAGSYVVIDGDRATFDALVQSGGSSVVDSHGAFAPDPAAATGQASLLRSGTIGGVSFAYEAFDVDFSAAPTGFLTVGAVGGDIYDLDFVDVELPASQSGATGSGSFGLDSGSGSTATPNALLVHFGVTPGGLGVGHFGVDLLDFEASGLFTTGQLRLYDHGALVFAAPIDFGAGAGNDEAHFLGVIADPTQGGVLFDTVAFVLGDDSSGDGRFERWAADRFTFGLAVVSPEPGSAALLGVGILFLTLWLRGSRGARGQARRRASRTNTSSAT